MYKNNFIQQTKYKYSKKKNMYITIQSKQLKFETINKIKYKREIACVSFNTSK